MPNSRLARLVAERAPCERSAQRSDSSMARSISCSLGRQCDAFVELHLDVGIEQALDLDRALRATARRRRRRYASGRSRPVSSSLRSLASDITWKPPLSVRIGCGQRANSMQAAQPRDALGAGPQHQVIGVAEHDVGAGART